MKDREKKMIEKKKKESYIKNFSFRQLLISKISINFQYYIIIELYLKQEIDIINTLNCGYSNITTNITTNNTNNTTVFTI